MRYYLTAELDKDTEMTGEEIQEILIEISNTFPGFHSIQLEPVDKYLNRISEDGAKLDEKARKEILG